MYSSWSKLAFLSVQFYLYISLADPLLIMSFEAFHTELYDLIIFELLNSL